MRGNWYRLPGSYSQQATGGSNGLMGGAHPQGYNWPRPGRYGPHGSSLHQLCPAMPRHAPPAVRSFACRCTARTCAYCPSCSWTTRRSTTMWTPSSSTSCASATSTATTWCVRHPTLFPGALLTNGARTARRRGPPPHGPRCATRRPPLPASTPWPSAHILNSYSQPLSCTCLSNTTH